MRPIRFCMVTTFYPPFNFGGDGIGIQRLSRGLKRRGHHVTVIHDVDAFRMLSPRPLSLPQPDPDGLDVHRLEGGFGRFSSLRIHQTGHPGPRGRQIEKILERTGGNITRSAEILRIDRVTLYNKIKKYGLRR